VESFEIMKSTFTILESYSESLVGVLSQRVTTAKEMYDITKKTHSHSEYDGCWDIFERDMSEWLDKTSVIVSFNFSYFEGVSDIIFEIKVFLRQKRDGKNTHDIYSEQISGTVLQELFKHFDLTGWNTPSLEGGHHTDELKKLSVFKNK